MVSNKATARVMPNRDYVGQQVLAIQTSPYIIEFYNEDVRQVLNDFPNGIRARTFALFQKMEFSGCYLPNGLTKAMGKGLFELRVKAKEGIGRTFYCTLIGRRIVVLHAFVKKSQKTPHKDLEIARSRLKELKNETNQNFS